MIRPNVYVLLLLLYNQKSIVETNKKNDPGWTLCLHVEVSAADKQTAARL